MLESGKRSFAGRSTLVIGLLAVWSMLILVRLFELQILRHGEFVQLAIKGQLVTKSIIAPRGVIYDSHMDELASSVTVRTVVAEPKRIEDVPRAARGLAAILGIN